MEPQTTTTAAEQFTKVTSLSKALAAILFIVLPFVGLYIGYTFAPEKVVEVEKVVVQEVEVEKAVTEQVVANSEFSKVALEIFYAGVDKMEESGRSFGFGQYIWSGGKIYEFHSFYGETLTELIELSTEEISRATVLKKQISSNGGSYTKDVGVLVTPSRVFDGATMLEGLDPTTLVFDEDIGVLYDEDTAFIIYLKCDGFVFSEVERSWVEENSDREITGC